MRRRRAGTASRARARGAAARVTARPMGAEEARAVCACALSVAKRSRCRRGERNGAATHHNQDAGGGGAAARRRRTCARCARGTQTCGGASNDGRTQGRGARAHGGRSAAGSQPDGCAATAPGGRRQHAPNRPPLQAPVCGVNEAAASQSGSTAAASLLRSPRPAHRCCLVQPLHAMRPRVVCVLRRDVKSNGHRGAGEERERERAADAGQHSASATTHVRRRSRSSRALWSTHASTPAPPRTAHTRAQRRHLQRNAAARHARRQNRIIVVIGANDVHRHKRRRLTPPRAAAPMT
jgi:hypothetical protein